LITPEWDNNNSKSVVGSFFVKKRRVIKRSVKDKSLKNG